MGFDAIKLSLIVAVVVAAPANKRRSDQIQLAVKMQRERWLDRGIWANSDDERCKLLMLIELGREEQQVWLKCNDFDVCFEEHHNNRKAEAILTEKETQARSFRQMQ